MLRYVCVVVLVVATVECARDGLAGLNLRGCALLENPYVKLGAFGHRGTNGFSGVAIDYLDKMRDLTGFKIQLKQWNGTFGAFVDHMSSCRPRIFFNSTLSAQLAKQSPNCECDIGVGAFTMTDERVKKIDFLWPFANENHRMVSRRSDLTTVDGGNLSYMFKTFSIPVWILITLAVFVYAAGTVVFGDITPVSRDRYPSHRSILQVRRRRSAESADAVERKRMRCIPPPPNVFEAPTESSLPNTTPPSTDGESSFMLRLAPEGYPARDSFSHDNISLEPSKMERFEEHGCIRAIANCLIPRAQRFGVAVIYTFAMFIGHPVEADSAGSRTASMHRISWRLLSLTGGIFLFCLYNASLTVLLFESVKTSRFQSLEDVKDCVVNPSSVTFIRGGASEQLWNNAITSRKFCDEDASSRVAVKNMSHALEMLRQKKADYFFTLEGAVLSVVHRHCDEFAVVGEPFFSSSVGFIVPKNSDLKILLSKATRQLREQDAFHSARTIAMRSSCDEVSGATITLDRLWFFFVAYFLTVGLLVAYRVYTICQRQ